MNFMVPVVAAILAAVPASAGTVEVRNVAPERYPEVSVLFRVLNNQGRAVPGLSGTDLSLTEDGRPVTGFEVRPSFRDDGHVAVSLLIDRSGSMVGPALQGAIAGARGFLERLVPEDRVELIAFGRPMEVITPFGPPEALVGIDNLTAKGDTALYDAINRGLIDLSTQEAKARAIVVLTDGRDDGSQVSLGFLRDAVAAAPVPIHGIGLRSEVFDPGPLQELARLSGGSYREVTNPTELADVYRTIAAELASEYRISFRSSALPGLHTVEISAQTPDGSVQGRKEYTAPGSTAPTPPRPASKLPVFLLVLMALGVVAAVATGARRTTRRKPLVIPVDRGRTGESATGLVLEGSGVSIPVTATAMLIGRDPMAQVVVDDPTISRQHAKLEFSPDGLWIEDLGSANGTTVNGSPVTRQMLYPGDVLQVGDLSLELRGGQA